MSLTDRQADRQTDGDQHLPRHVAEYLLMWTGCWPACVAHQLQLDICCLWGWRQTGRCLAGRHGVGWTAQLPGKPASQCFQTPCIRIAWLPVDKRQYTCVFSYKHVMSQALTQFSWRYCKQTR